MARSFPMGASKSRVPKLGGVSALYAFSACAVLSFTGCHSPEPTDDTPPDHIIKVQNSQGKYRFGVTDTLTFDFTEKIDTSALDPSFDPDTLIAYRFADAARMQVFGTEESHGSAHFMVGMPALTLTLADLRDRAGNKSPDIVQTFVPYPWVDKDYLDTSFTGYDSLFSSDSTWVDGSPLTDSLVVEGNLDFNSNFRREDRQDYKIVKLEPPDTLHVRLTHAKNLSVRMQIAGPFAPETLDADLDAYDFKTSFFDSTGAQGRLAHAFNADYSEHHRLLDSPSAPGIYVIRLSIPADTEGFYRLGFRVRKLEK